MNLEKINEIINSNSHYHQKELDVIKVLAEDELVIPLILKVLESERIQKADLIQRFNWLLSMSNTCLKDGKYIEGSNIKVLIEEFYEKNKNVKDVGLVF